MRLKTFACSIVIALAAIFLAGCLGAIAPPAQGVWQVSHPGKIDLPTPDQPAQPQCCLTQPTPTPAPTPVLTIHEKTTLEALKVIGYKPTLRAYYIDKSNDIWHPYDASSYITPQSPWVLYYAILGETPQINYKSDAELYPNNPDQDYWQNADYTLYTGTGDCEDIAIAKVSIYIARGFKAMAVSGYIEDSKGNRYRDTWIEFFNPKTGIKSTILTTADAQTTAYRLSPVYMFNDKTQWSTYNENWYNS